MGIGSSLEWVVGSRTISAPELASQELKDLVGNGVPSVAEMIAITPTDDAGWTKIISAADSAIEAVTRDLAASMGVVITPSVMAGVPIFDIVPPEVNPALADRLFVLLHGGAYIAGNGMAGAHEGVLVAARAAIHVIVIDYSMPPARSPFPAALNEVEAVYRELLLNRPARSIAIGGTSAGAGLSLASVHNFKQQGIDLPGAVFAGTPWSDLTGTGDSYRIHEGVDGALVTYQGPVRGSAELYADGHDLRHPFISPVYGDFSGFPPTQLVSGTRDLLLSDTVRVQRKLREAGVPEDLIVYEGMSHSDYKNAPGSAESIAVYRELGEFLVKYLN